MNNNKWKIMVIVLILVVLAGFVIGWLLFKKPASLESTPTATQSDSEFVLFPSPKGEIVKIKTPRNFVAVKSPLIVAGEARGTWAFEGSFPAQLKDANGKILAEVPATLQGEWMTTEYVPFLATLTFAKPATKQGTLTLRKDNPSDQRELDDAIEIPVTFE